MTEPEIITTSEPGAEVVACAETEATATTRVEEESRNVHAMSKEELLADLRQIVETKSVNSHREVMAIKQALFSLRQREVNDEMNAHVEAGNAPETFSANPDAAENEAKELIARFRELRQAYLEAEEERLSKNLEERRRIIAEMETIVADTDNVNLHFQKFQELQQGFRDIKDVTPSAETEIWKQFQSVVEQYYDTLKMNKELRDLDFRKNLEVKRRIIADAKALAEEADVVEAGRKLQTLHAEWRETGPVVKELRDEIWEEFKEASGAVNRRHQEFFEQRKAEEKRNEEAKEAIIAAINGIDREALKSFVAWDEAADRIKALQADWKALGFASRKVNNDLFARYRAACDAFFEAKTAYFQTTRDGYQANLEAKTRLCERAEALLAQGDSKKNYEELQKLQAEWRTIGTVPRKHSDAIWQRFTTACNAFFALRKEKNAKRQADEQANLEAKREILAAIKEIPLDVDRREGLRRIKELQERWESVGHVPFKLKDQLHSEYREACNALYGAFSASRSKERRQHFEGQLSNMKDDSRKLGSERDRLMRQIDAKSQELKTYANNLGFFNVKTSAGSSMLKEMERKMARIEEEIAQLKEKIRMIDAAKNVKE
ncbi:MAG: DUF349 domain-containing protein [Muribaculaceae bacterium]|nr:DUF349 domain-containing protein [Muribaculaceae bacterium]